MDDILNMEDYVAKKRLNPDMGMMVRNVPTWASRLAHDDLAAARKLAAEHKTYENIVNVQRLKRVADEEALEHRATFRLIQGSKPCR